jgi:hypothetical protein
LVVLGNQDVIPSRVDDLSGQVPLAEHGIAHHDFVLEGDQPQESQSGFVLVGLGIHAHLGEDRLDLRGIGGDQMLAGDLAVSAAA